MTTKYEMSKLEWGTTFPAFNRRGGRKQHPSLPLLQGFLLDFCLSGGGAILFFRLSFWVAAAFLGWCRPHFRRISFPFLNNASGEKSCLFTELVVHYFPDRISFLPKNVQFSKKCCIYLCYVHMLLFCEMGSGSYASISELFWGCIEVVGYKNKVVYL